MTEQSAFKEIPVVLHSRHVKIDEARAAEMRRRTAELDRFGNNLLSFDVEIGRNFNPSVAKNAWEVEIAARARGHLLRATGRAGDWLTAFDIAHERMEASLRRAARRMHWSRHGRKSVATLRHSL